jgi:serine/threonine protein kinase
VYESLSDLYLVLELAEGGELFDRIKDAGAFSEKQASAILRQMVEGLKHMHDRSIAHCDLKPDNFLFGKREGKSGGDVVKIIDFGMSKFVQSRKYFQVLSGTPYYVSKTNKHHRTLAIRITRSALLSCGSWLCLVVRGSVLFFPSFLFPLSLFSCRSRRK